MNVIKTDLPGVLLIEPKVFADDRGFFLETYSYERYQQHGMNLPFVQDNHSRSSAGVLRGLHYQLKVPQGKLVRVVTGRVFDVAVDIRYGSSTFGQWVGVELSETNHRSLYIPPGFAHGFYGLSEQVDFCYKCTDYYTPGDEYGIAWQDPDIGIQWPLAAQAPILSEKDQQYPVLSAVPKDQLPIFGE